MGPSGSGKSTLLNLAGRLDVPTAGHVFVDGVDLATLDVRGLATVRRQTVGYIFQKLNLLPTLTVVENVMLPLELDGTSARAARAAAPTLNILSRYSLSCGAAPARLTGGTELRDPPGAG
jgi:putative ABC transport system ATP-binding protein